MQDKTISVLTEKEMQFASDLQLLGMDRNTAKVLTYLCLVGPATSRQLEMAADMRQPDVSRGLKLLRPNTKTSSEGRQLLFTIENPMKSIDAYFNRMMAKREEQDNAYARLVEKCKTKTKNSASPIKKSKKSKKTEDPEVTLDV